MARLQSVMLLVRDVQRSVQFYTKGMGLPVAMATDTWAQIGTGHTPIILKAVAGEAACTTGYSPFLTFHVEDLDITVTQMLQEGAVLDGAIKRPSTGPVAALRTPDGHMVTIIEPAQVAAGGGY